MLKRLFLVLMLVPFFYIANAQTQGCYLSGVLYDNTGATIPTACGWRTPAVTGSTWSTTLKNQCSSYGGVAGGYIGLACPIDDYIPYLVVALGGIGFFFIRNNKYVFNS